MLTAWLAEEIVLQLLINLNLADSVSFVSTGGGAMLSILKAKHFQE
ncbi:MAG: hypothetical protein WKF59_06805 [Chitinophagaceae bacterium]